MLKVTLPVVIAAVLVQLPVAQAQSSSSAQVATFGCIYDNTIDSVFAYSSSDKTLTPPNTTAGQRTPCADYISYLVSKGYGFQSTLAQVNYVGYVMVKPKSVGK